MRIGLAVVLAGCTFHPVNVTSDAIGGGAGGGGDARPVDAVADAPPPAIAFVQGSGVEAAGMNEIAVPFAMPQVAGDLNLVVVVWNQGGVVIDAVGTAKVTDAAGNTYAEIGSAVAAAEVGT